MVPDTIIAHLRHILITGGPASIRSMAENMVASEAQTAGVAPEEVAA